MPTSRRGRWQRESAPGGLDGKVDSPEAVGLAPAPGAGGAAGASRRDLRNPFCGTSGPRKERPREEFARGKSLHFPFE